jgi:nucleoside-diphosphate-sugar epimerase/quercetin dioxygenase-like cupin family protein/SAM-dependent methyltransferase
MNYRQKIVITGGLGYIGTELCKLYSGEARFKNIVILDTRFVSERVKQLRDWGIDFHQVSILDKDNLQSHLADADVVFHLAGITDVAYVKTESDPEKDSLITKTAVEGTRNVINSVSKNCKIVFPSTHVVYEGFAETKLDILETEPPCPVLTYAAGKVQSEEDFKNSDLNYVILRLASVYGYSTDTMRLGIMPNLFSKIASQNGTIKLFSGGVQVKSLVPLQDVVRCMKYMAENNTISREIFHLAKETTTVKQVAELCKEINPSLQIVETNDEIPNLGYTISNAKLLATGFTFRYSLKECLKEMICNWSKKDINPALEYIDRGGKEFIDARGKILNYELTEPINLIGYIESKKGTVRANHYHPIQEQKCLLVKGQYISVIKDLSIPDAPIETRVINEGDIAIIKPNVAHAMIFTEDSIFLNLVRGEREHANYGISHTIPYILVDEEMRIKLLSSYKITCRCCGNKHLERVISLGESPLANNLKDSIDAKEDKYPLEMNYCPKCHNCQLSVSVPPEKMFDNYLYVSSTSPIFRKHFEDAAREYIDEFNLNSSTLVVDIGSNDGIALKPLAENGIPVIGIEPAKNVAEIANTNGIRTLNKYFDDEAVESLLSIGKAKLITASNMFAHSDKLAEIANNVFKVLDDDGTFVIEVQYLKDTLNDVTFDNIYHEHYNYWSVISLNNFFNNLGYVVYKVNHINTHGGSIRVYIAKNPKTIDASVHDFIDAEKIFGLTNFQTYAIFAKKIETIKNNVISNIKMLKSKYGSICAYGSPAKATTALNYFNIGKDYFDYTIDDNALKNLKFIPGVNIQIQNREYFKSNKSKVVIVLAWNFFESIKNNNKEYIDNGIVFLNIKNLENLTDL